MSSSIPIVQGVAVGPPKTSQYQSVGAVATPATANNYYHVADVSTSYNGQENMQQLRASPIKQYQDVIWAVLFIAHLIAISIYIVFGMMNSSSTSLTMTAITGPILFLTSVTGLTAVTLSAFSLTFMMYHATLLIQAGLFFSCGCTLIMSVVGFLSGSIMMGILGLISFAVSIWYTYLVWKQIPFAAANLNTALSAVRDNMGLTVVSFIFTLIAFAWTFLWFSGVGGAYVESNSVVIFLLVRNLFCLHG
jgi:Plasma-membrane choline transporter